jgi:hypothetical protein
VEQKVHVLFGNAFLLVPQQTSLHTWKNLNYNLSALSVASHFTDVNNTYKTCLPHCSIQNLVANTLSMEENLHITSKQTHEQ